MYILTPTGYRDIADCAVGDDVSAFNMVTGEPLVNRIESLQWIDLAEWSRWWQVEPIEPPFQFYRINGTWTLNSEQSIWRNADEVCHAKDLVVGDVIFDDADHDVTITSIETITPGGWWRFDISGDHSYIVDGLTLHNASRFWVGGTGSWDGSSTANWSATSGGSAGASVPGSADAVTFNGSSGGGTVTVNTTVTIQSITCGAFTGTLDFSANNNNVTLNASSGFSNNGTATRTLNLGNGTWTLSGAAGAWSGVTITGLTFNANGSTIALTGTSSAARTFEGGGLTYNNITIDPNSSGGQTTLTGANTFNVFTVNAPNAILFPAATTTTIATLAVNGVSGSAIFFASNNFSTNATISVATGSPAITWAGIRRMTFSGGASFAATSSLDLLANGGITINAPLVRQPIYAAGI